mmetsp:Transcript_14/g.66  ORF Transcript_14/g.66 Transcript_14/m.66 type:complete len:90 (-) Transcript_14:3043-3312(-)
MGHHILNEFSPQFVRLTEVKRLHLFLKFHEFKTSETSADTPPLSCILLINDKFTLFSPPAEMHSNFKHFRHNPYCPHSIVSLFSLSCSE